MVQKKWQPSLKKWFPQGNANPKVALIKVHVTECDYWDAGENRMIKLFHNIKAALTGHNGKQPDHEKIDFRKQ